MTRGYLISGANKCQGASWSGEFDDKEFREALGGERDLELRGYPIFGHCLPILLCLLQCGMLILKSSPCTAVMQYSSTSYDSVFSPLVRALMFQSCDFKTICVSNPHVEIALEASIVLSERVVSANSRSS